MLDVINFPAEHKPRERIPTIDKAVYWRGKAHLDEVMNTVWKFMLLGLCLYAGIAALVYFRQSSLIYYPNVPGRALTATPQLIGLAYEDVEIVTADGVRLHGWFVPGETARGTLLFFHGNAGNISHRLDSIALFQRMQLNVLIIDYRGYGRSEGRASESGTYRDAEAAWFYLTETRGIEASAIIVFGRSLGASIAAWLASRQRPAGLILESGFSSVPSMAERLYPFLPVRWLSNFRYDTRRYVGGIACPLLVVHSRGDEIIPYAEGRAVFDAAPADKRFLDIAGGHNDGFLVSGQTYRKGLQAFIDHALHRR